MRRSLLSRIVPLLGVLIFGAALWVLQHELSIYQYQDIVNSVRQVSTRRILLAACITVTNFIALTPATISWLSAI